MKERRVVVEPEVARAEPPRDVVQRALDDPRDRLRRERLEHDDLAAGQQRAVQLEGRVLGRGADQDDVPGFDVREEDVLLGAVEAVDLVEKQDRALALAGAQAPRLLEDLAHLLDARRDGRVRQEERGRLRRDQPRQRRLADARRPPEDERRNAVLGDRPPQEPVGADDRLRALDLVERARPHPVGERRRAARAPVSPASRRAGPRRRGPPLTAPPRGGAGIPRSRRRPSRRRVAPGERAGGRSRCRRPGRAPSPPRGAPPCARRRRTAAEEDRVQRRSAARAAPSGAGRARRRGGRRRAISYAPVRRLVDLLLDAVELRDLRVAAA